MRHGKHPFIALTKMTPQATQAQEKKRRLIPFL
jgi:hypothetical protein